MSEEKMKEWPPCPTLMGYDPDWEKKQLESTNVLNKKFELLLPAVAVPGSQLSGRQGKRRSPLPP